MKPEKIIKEIKKSIESNKSNFILDLNKELVDIFKNNKKIEYDDVTHELLEKEEKLNIENYDTVADFLIKEFNGEIKREGFFGVVFYLPVSYLLYFDDLFSDLLFEFCIDEYSKINKIEKLSDEDEDNFSNKIIEHPDFGAIIELGYDIFNDFVEQKIYQIFKNYN
jgi:hypothetical protein